MSDPVADKIFKQIESLPKIEIPEDRSISTLYIGGLDGIVTEKDLRCVFTRVYTVCVCACVRACVHACVCVCVLNVWWCACLALCGDQECGLWQIRTKNLL